MMTGGDEEGAWGTEDKMIRETRVKYANAR